MLKEISAKELEAACRKCTHIIVTDTKALARVLDDKNLEYDILSDTEADIFSTVNVTELSKKLAEQNCDICTMQEKNETLESYYIRLTGGINHE